MPGWQTTGTPQTRLAHTALQCWQNTTSESTILVFHYRQPYDPSHDYSLESSITRVPFYIAMPMSTLDRNCPTGQNIPIEQVFYFFNTLIITHNTDGSNTQPNRAGFYGLFMDYNRNIVGFKPTFRRNITGT